MPPRRGRNRALNATHRPRTLLSGLLFCGCCGGSYARRGQERYACTNHALGNGCDNARTVARKALEARVLNGLRKRMMTPDMVAEAVRVIEQGGYHRALSERLNELEARQDRINAHLLDAPQDVPDIHPGIAETYRRRIERLTDALDHPDDRAEATGAISEIIDRVVITPGPTRRDFSVTLQGELGTILDWIGRTGKPAAVGRSAQLSASVNTRV